MRLSFTEWRIVSLVQTKGALFLSAASTASDCFMWATVRVKLSIQTRLVMGVGTEHSQICGLIRHWVIV